MQKGISIFRITNAAAFCLTIIDHKLDVRQSASQLLHLPGQNGCAAQYTEPYIREVLPGKFRIAEKGKIAGRDAVQNTAVMPLDTMEKMTAFELVRDCDCGPDIHSGQEISA